MPRVSFRVTPPEQQAKRDELLSRYGALMRIKDVGEFIGVKRYADIHKWLTGVPSTNVNGRPKWAVELVAQRWYESTYGYLAL